MKLVKAYNSVSLVLRIVIGMVIGAALDRKSTRLNSSHRT